MYIERGDKEKSLTQYTGNIELASVRVWRGNSDN